MNIIEVVRYFKFGNLLVVVVIFVLGCYFGYFGDFQKGYLNLLGGIIYFRRLGFDCIIVVGFVEFGVGGFEVIVLFELIFID